VQTGREGVQRDHRLNDVREQLVEARAPTQPLDVRPQRRRALTGALSAVAVLAGDGADALGAALAALGIAVTVAAQFAMGDSWRIGVDSAERTALVTDGPFAVVRNPIYAGMIPAFAGIALLAPNVVTIAGAILLVVALELQTRLVEEPYLARVHGESYAAYAARAGRFLPGIGRLRLDGGAL
jgi:protein-S-isoprenylcysteine O-methyltransferase Ste14